MSAWRTEHHEVLHTTEFLAVEVAVRETKAWSACKFLEGFSGTIHSSPVRHLTFMHRGFQLMPSATDTHRAGLTACVVTQCWPHFDCPIISGLSQCLSSPNLSPIQAGSPMGPATGSSAATRVTVLPLLRQYPSDTK